MTVTIAHVLIVEDQPEGQRYLAEVVRLAYPHATIEKASSLSEALPLANRDYDLALVDLRLGDGLGIDWVARYRTRRPLALVVIATLFDDDELVFAALRAGVDGYVLKEQSAAAVAAALSGLACGEPAISPRIARKVLGHFRSAPPTPAPTADEEALTVREREVLACIGQGLSIKQTADSLGIKYFTVNHYIKSVYRKLSIHTRAQAATEALRRGLI